MTKRNRKGRKTNKKARSQHRVIDQHDYQQRTKEPKKRKRRSCSIAEIALVRNELFGGIYYCVGDDETHS